MASKHWNTSMVELERWAQQLLRRGHSHVFADQDELDKKDKGEVHMMTILRVFWELYRTSPASAWKVLQATAFEDVSIANPYVPFFVSHSYNAWMKDLKERQGVTLESKVKKNDVIDDDPLFEHLARALMIVSSTPKSRIAFNASLVAAKESTGTLFAPINDITTIFCDAVSNSDEDKLLCIGTIVWRWYKMDTKTVENISADQRKGLKEKALATIKFCWSKMIQGEAAKFSDEELRLTTKPKSKATSHALKKLNELKESPINFPIKTMHKLFFTSAFSGQRQFMFYTALLHTARSKSIVYDDGLKSFPTIGDAWSEWIEKMQTRGKPIKTPAYAIVKTKKESAKHFFEVTCLLENTSDIVEDKYLEEAIRCYDIEHPGVSAFVGSLLAYTYGTEEENTRKRKRDAELSDDDKELLSLTKGEEPARKRRTLLNDAVLPEASQKVSQDDLYGDIDIPEHCDETKLTKASTANMLDSDSESDSESNSESESDDDDDFDLLFNTTTMKKPTAVQEDEPMQEDEPTEVQEDEPMQEDEPAEVQEDEPMQEEDSAEVQEDEPMQEEDSAEVEDIEQKESSSVFVKSTEDDALYCDDPAENGAFLGSDEEEEDEGDDDDSDITDMFSGYKYGGSAAVDTLKSDSEIEENQESSGDENDDDYDVGLAVDQASPYKSKASVFLDPIRTGDADDTFFATLADGTKVFVKGPIDENDADIQRWLLRFRTAISSDNRWVWTYSCVRRHALPSSNFFEDDTFTPFSGDACEAGLYLVFTDLFDHDPSHITTSECGKKKVYDFRRNENCEHLDVQKHFMLVDNTEQTSKIQRSILSTMAWRYVLEMNSTRFKDIIINHSAGSACSVNELDPLRGKCDQFFSEKLSKDDKNALMMFFDDADRFENVIKPVMRQCRYLASHIQRRPEVLASLEDHDFGWTHISRMGNHLKELSEPNFWINLF